MAHGLNKNKAMAYAGDEPWHGLGQKVLPGVDAEEMMRAAHLDWKVLKRPARGASVAWAENRALLQPGAKIGPNDDVEYSRYELVRPGDKDQQEETVLGIVSARYEPLQNKDAFAFFDPLIERKQASYETAGALGDGERVWVMAKMPGMIDVVRGDECQQYLLLSNTHDGKGSVVVKFTAVRVVCQNTLALALKDGQTAYRVRHSKRTKDRLDEVAALMAMATEVYTQAATLFRKMASVQLKAKRLEEYLYRVYPKTETQRKKQEVPPKWMEVQRLLETLEDLQYPGVQGTLWAAYNAITYFEDHKLVEGESRAGRLNRVWFGGGELLKLKALRGATEMMTSM
jgi:phage/plasmid-like protein (TIGR03299 family)